MDGVTVEPLVAPHGADMSLISLFMQAAIVV